MSLIHTYLVLVPCTNLMPTDVIAVSVSGLARLTRMYVHVRAVAAGMLIVSLAEPKADALLKTIVKSPAAWVTEDLNQNSRVSCFARFKALMSLYPTVPAETPDKNKLPP